MCTTKFDYISSFVSACMFSVSCFERSTCLTDIKFGAVISFIYVNTCGCVFFLLIVFLALFLRFLWSVFVVYAVTFYSFFNT
jgi:hypothetical protein